VLQSLRGVWKAVYVCHAFGSDPAGNAVSVRRACRALAEAGHLPLAPQLLFPDFLDEAMERDQALRLCLKLVALSDEVRVFGTVTEGMHLEITEARRLGIPVVAGDHEGEMSLTGEPPR